ncbi:major facilitator superfamily transporter [Colletotrichum tabaci]|uniref:Major facilitator superfamily transporter n=1 Tax=Colletotrichum tabaci TaxID=1209068 RepID=A0AAV9SS86_9PEZI
MSVLGKNVDNSAMEAKLKGSPSDPVSHSKAESVINAAQLYTGSVDENYRMKSELIAKHLGEIGMGNF